MKLDLDPMFVCERTAGSCLPLPGKRAKGEANATAKGMDCALQRPFNTVPASNVCDTRIESLLASRFGVYNPNSDHLAGGLVQQGLSVAMNIAPRIHVEARQINAIR